MPPPATRLVGAIPPARRGKPLRAARRSPWGERRKRGEGGGPFEVQRLQKRPPPCWGGNVEPPSGRLLVDLASRSVLAGQSDVALTDVGERESKFEGRIYCPELGLARDHASLSCKRHRAASVEEEIVVEQVVGG